MGGRAMAFQSASHSSSAAGSVWSRWPRRHGYGASAALSSSKLYSSSERSSGVRFCATASPSWVGLGVGEGVGVGVGSEVGSEVGSGAELGVGSGVGSGVG